MKVTLDLVRTNAFAAASIAAFCLKVITAGEQAVVALATHLTTLASEDNKSLAAAIKLYMSFSKEANNSESLYRIRSKTTRNDAKKIISAEFTMHAGGKLRGPRTTPARNVTPQQAEVDKANAIAGEATVRADNAAEQLRRLELALAAVGLSAEQIAGIRSGSIDPVTARRAAHDAVLHVNAGIKPAGKPAAKPQADTAAAPAAATSAKPKPATKPRTVRPAATLAPAAAAA